VLLVSAYIPPKAAAFAGLHRTLGACKDAVVPRAGAFHKRNTEEAPLSVANEEEEDFPHNMNNREGMAEPSCFPAEAVLMHKTDGCIVAVAPLHFRETVLSDLHGLPVAAW